MLRAAWRRSWEVTTDAIVLIIVVILWSIYAHAGGHHRQVHSQHPQREGTCRCPVHAKQLQGLPIGLGSWQETLGACVMIYQAGYGVIDAWGGWVRTPACKASLFDCDSIGAGGDQQLCICMQRRRALCMHVADF